jgi:hypothetical protein
LLIEGVVTLDLLLGQFALQLRAAQPIGAQLRATAPPRLVRSA